jgi:branched-chain amino acid transport system substrate-binding protein
VVETGARDRTADGDITNLQGSKPEGLAHRCRQIKAYWELYRSHIEARMGGTVRDLGTIRRNTFMRLITILRGASLAALLCVAGAANAQQVTVGQLIDFSGPTADVGVPFGQGVIDAIAWANKKGGVTIALDTVDYSYQVPRAVAQYKKWSGSTAKVPAILGYGTADTEALTGFIAQDQIPYFSASYSAALTDPTGASGKAKPAPYNFFYAPSYSDALRAMLTWAAQDWKAKGKTERPKYVHMGANHPYPNAPKEAGEAIAKELGFEVLPPVQFALTPGDYTPQCLTLKNAGANYAFLGNTAGSNIAT